MTEATATQRREVEVDKTNVSNRNMRAIRLQEMGRILICLRGGGEDLKRTAVLIKMDF